MRRLSLVLFCVLILSACTTAPTKWSDPRRSATIARPQFNASIVPDYVSWNGTKMVTYRGFTTLVLTVENKTDDDIEIDWNRTQIHSQRHDQRRVLLSGHRRPGPRCPPAKRNDHRQQDIQEESFSQRHGLLVLPGPTGLLVGAELPAVRRERDSSDIDDQRPKGAGKNESLHCRFMVRSAQGRHKLRAVGTI
jgi:hypothetical protein